MVPSHQQTLRTRRSLLDQMSLLTSNDLEKYANCDMDYVPLKRRSGSFCQWIKNHRGMLLVLLTILTICFLLSVNRSSFAWSGLQTAAFTSELYFNGSHYFKPTVIMISLDGFRNDYLQRDITPNLWEISRMGIRAEYMLPSFPSSTFPNHWTLATGLYPESHGIVGNFFHDPTLNSNFVHKVPGISNKPIWWSGEPIWYTARSQDKKSSVIMWPGSTVPNTLANHVVSYDRSMVPKKKVAEILSYTDQPIESRPELIAAYFPEVDQKGHGGGPDGKQMNIVISNVDQAIGELLAGLRERHLEDHVHLIVLSDHGMMGMHKSRVIFYDDILSPESLSYIKSPEAWPLLNLRPKESAPPHMADQIYNELYNYTQSAEEPHFQVYLRQNVPERWHYSATERIAPIVVVPDVGYALATHSSFNINSGKDYHPRGIHGYDNFAPEMHAIFMAQGPMVTEEYGRGSTLEGFTNVEVYEFITHLLDLSPAPNNGTLHGKFNIKTRVS